MQIKMKCKRALAFVLALLMLMTMLPTAAFAEELPSDVATSTDVAADPIASQENEPVSEEPTAPDEASMQRAVQHQLRQSFPPRQCCPLILLEYRQGSPSCQYPQTR